MTTTRNVKGLDRVVKLAPCACGCGKPAPVRSRPLALAGTPGYAKGHYLSDRLARATYDRLHRHNYPSSSKCLNIYIDPEDRLFAARSMKRRNLKSISALIRQLLKEDQEG